MSEDDDNKVQLTWGHIDRLLSELSVDFGFCLPKEKRFDLVHHPPTSIDAFTEAVFAAEGMDCMLNRPLYKEVRKKVADHLQRFREFSD